MGADESLLKRRWLPYAFAKAALSAATHRPNTREEWWAWWDRNEPAGIPRNPHRVYLNDWTSWNDWLDNDNEFVIKEKGNWRNYFAAMKYVHSRKFENKPGYKAAVEEDDWPEDIPRCPQVVYSEWDSWSTWLGVTLRSRIKVMEEIDQYMAICTIGGLSANIVKVLIARGGMDDLKRQLEDAGNLRIYKMYMWDPSSSEEVMALFDHAGTDHGNGEYHIHHMHSLMFELDNILMMYRAK